MKKTAPSVLSAVSPDAGESLLFQGGKNESPSNTLLDDRTACDCYCRGCGLHTGDDHCQCTNPTQGSRRNHRAEFRSKRDGDAGYADAD